MGDAAEKRDEEPVETAWLATKKAAAYLDMTEKALLMHIARGNIKPDGWGGRGRTKSHRFSRQTLDAYLSRTRLPKSPVAPSALEESARRGWDAPKHLYVVEFVGYCIKVGISSNPTKRLATHAADGKRFGRKIGRVWFSVRHKEARLNETLLKSRTGSEWLRRKRFEDIVEMALALDYTPPGAPNG